MIYLFGYFGLGAISLVLVLVFDRIAKKNESLLTHLLNPTGPITYGTALGLVSIGLLILAFWPIVVFLKIKDAITGVPDISEIPEESEFAVTHEDFLTQMSLPEIEKREMVLDPMGAAPRLPFGHLNPAWRKFLEETQPSDVFWSFSAKYTRWQRTELRQGYVVVRGDEIGPFFMTTRTHLDEDEKNSPKGKTETHVDIPSFLRKQAYNAQAAVDTNSLLIVAPGVTQAYNGKEQVRPMLDRMTALPDALGQAKHLLADTGFYSAGNIQACEAQGIDPFIAVKRDEHHLAPLDRFTESTALPESATPVQAMDHKLKTKAGRALYALRKQTVEPVFGIIKSILGFRQFSLRGLQKVTSEWTRVCLAWNLKRMAVLRPQ